MDFPCRDDVLSIHARALELFGGPSGVRDEGLLDSALAAPKNRQHYEGADLAICAATYAFHLVRNHPFIDGNKRTGAAVSEIFVRMNGAKLSATNDEIVEMFLAIAAGAVTREEVEHAFTRWLVLPS